MYFLPARYIQSTLVLLLLLSKIVPALANQGIDSAPNVDLPISGGGTQAITVGGGQNVTAGDVDFLNNVGIGTPSPSQALEVAQNKAIKLGNAYLSSGGDYTHLANNEWYDGAHWHQTASGVLYQQTGLTNYWYIHDSSGNHTTRMSLDGTGKLGINSSNTYLGNAGFFFGSAGGDLWYDGGSDGYFSIANTSSLSSGGTDFVNLVNGSSRSLLFIRNDGSVISHATIYAKGATSDNNCHSNYQKGYHNDGSNCGSDNYSIFADYNVGAGGFLAYSDFRKKTDIESIKPEEGIDFVERVRPVHFHWKNDASQQDRKHGYVAQQLSAVGYKSLVSLAKDELIKSSSDEFDGVRVDSPAGAVFTANYEGVIPYLHAALKKALEEIKYLKAENDGQKAINDALRARLDALEARIK